VFDFGPLPRYVPLGIVYLDDDFSVVVDPPDAADDPAAFDSLFRAAARYPDLQDGSRWRRRGRTWDLAPELTFTLAVGDGPRADVVPALARLLRSLAGRPAAL
jgi:hypothetical protein